ncbi:MAG: hypothetical protein OXE52_05450 [Chloroflexi bacterium]|nr:hypothetical protein [Chloroflexota bacterium]
MSQRPEVDLLLQKKWREKVIPELGRRSNDQWIPVYRNENSEGKERLIWYSGLVPNEHVPSLLDSTDWEYYESDPVASFTGSYDAVSGEDTAKYYRFGPNPFNIEPLVLVRYFADLRPQQVELIEEFRLYHNLWYDDKRSTFIKFDDGGNEIDVVRVSQENVQISRLQLRQFLAARDMTLVVYFDRTYHPERTYEIPEQERIQAAKTENCSFQFKVIDGRDLIDGTPETYSWLRGKSVIRGLPRHQCGSWPYEEHLEEIELEHFIVTVDQDDKNVFASSSRFYEGPRSVKRSLSSDIVAAEYLSPVFFDRRVLNKYRDEPSKYTVSDGSLKCGNTLWRLDIDNNNPNHVIAWLGDLGRDLPHTEHAHWKAHNVRPDGRMSDSHRRAQLPSTVEEALDPGEPEDSALRFKRRYRSLIKAWTSQFGWHLFQPLREADSEILETLHIPSTNEVPAFDREILKLSKLLCDSINVKKIRQAIRNEEPDYNSKDAEGSEKKPITILDEYLTRCEFEQREVFIECLRTVQDLRSTGSAHRKGDKYCKAAKSVGLDTRPSSQVADEIFGILADCFRHLGAHFCPDDSARPTPPHRDRKE